MLSTAELPRGRRLPTCPPAYKPQVVLTGRRRFFYLLDVESRAVDRLASLRLWREEKSFESFVTSQHSPQPSEWQGRGAGEEGWGSGAHATPARVRLPDLEVCSLPDCCASSPRAPAVAAFFGNEGHVPLVSLHTKQVRSRGAVTVQSSCLF